MDRLDHCDHRSVWLCDCWIMAGYNKTVQVSSFDIRSFWCVSSALFFMWNLCNCGYLWSSSGFWWAGYKHTTMWLDSAQNASKGLNIGWQLDGFVLSSIVYCAPFWWFHVYTITFLHNILFLFFRITTIVIYILSLGGMVAFTFTLQLQKIWIVFLMAGALG